MIKKFLKKYWLLILIALLAFTLRVYKIDEYPVGITWDEPALGYNAYSILQTGRDEYGKFLPITLKSFGDEKPGFFVYYLIPSVALFGLNKFAIRLPSALAGVGMIVAIYFLVKLLFPKRKELTWLPHLSALLLAISPWHLHFSRGGWEVNLALLTIALGTIFFLKALETQANKFWLLAFSLFSISLYVYHGAKVFLVVLMVGALAIFWKELKSLPKQQKRLGLVLLILLLVPLLLSFRGSAKRAKVTNVFSYTRSEEEAAQLLSQEEFFPSLSYFVYHNEGINKVRWIAERYFNHFSGRFLFFEGDWQSPRHSTPYMGMMYYVEIPFLILGIGYALTKIKEKEKNFLFWWLIVSPVPAAVTRDAVHGLRSYWLVVPLMIFTAIGILMAFSWLKEKSKKLFWVSCLLLAGGYLACLIFYLDLYYVHFAKINSAGWNYGMEEVAKMIAENKDKYERIIVTQEYGQPYIFYLFYTQYPPEKYQPQAFLKENQWGDVGLVEKIDNIEFRNIYWPEDMKCQNCLFIGDEFELPPEEEVEAGARFIKTIYYLNGKVAFRIIETD